MGEWLSAGGQVLLRTALSDPRRRAVQAAWYTAGSAPVTRAPLPDDRLGTALLPLRVAGKTPGQRTVLAAAEQMVVALRSVFPCEPRPDRTRGPVPAGPGPLPGGCDNLADVLAGTRAGHGRGHALLVDAVRARRTGPVADLLTEPVADLLTEPYDPGRLVRALLDRADGGRTELRGLADGNVRYTALALALLTGPGVPGDRRARRVARRAAHPHGARRRSGPLPRPPPAHGTARPGGARVRARTRPSDRHGDRRLLGRRSGRGDSGTPGP